MNLNHTPKTVHKAWGTETWHVLSADFCVKTIRILKGYKTSYQWHRQKEEVNFIRAGEAEVWLEDESGVVQKHLVKVGDSFFVPATRKHRVIALTDVEMFEVSNEYVDDVVRIDDEFGRGDGRIETEHQTPAVLILAAGLGSRLKEHTSTKNKALLPLGGKAVISHIIEQFPPAYEVIIAAGYQKASLIDYCQLAHPERTIVFVDAPGWDNPKTDPGQSALACSHRLQRPFYLTAVDSVLGTPAPHLDGNWLGVYPTDCPERYATVKALNGAVTDVADKGGAVSFPDAFMGLASIRDYAAFWDVLQKEEGNQLIPALHRAAQTVPFRAKTLRWFDTGNLDDLRAAREHFGEGLSSPKSLDEVTYRVGNRVLKYHPDAAVTANRLARAKALGTLAPANVTAVGNVLAYDWVPGANLYHHGASVHRRFLQSLKDQECLGRPTKYEPHRFAAEAVYRRKTADRLSLFASRYGDAYLSTAFTVNGVGRRPVVDLVEAADLPSLVSRAVFYPSFHGDLHFDNVIYDRDRDTFTYIDWRESFGGNTAAGDLYYDLGKLYAGTIVPFELLKDDVNVTLSEGSSVVSYQYAVPDFLREFRREYESCLRDNHYDLHHVKVVAGLALLSIAPLHTDVWNKVLWFRGIEVLHDAHA